MSRRSLAVETLKSSGVVAILRMQQPERVLSVAEALAEGGVRAIEITMSVPGAVNVLRSVAERLENDVLLGAGTVLDAATAEQVIDAGARFVFSPVWKPELIEICHARDVAIAPGCFTPTEIYSASQAGADLVKVFPATSLGPSFFKDVLAPLPDLQLIPTGGVALDNVAQWIRAGAVAVGVGTALLDKQAIAEGRYGELRTRAEAFVSAVRAARSAK